MPRAQQVGEPVVVDHRVARAVTVGHRGGGIEQGADDSLDNRIPLVLRTELALGPVVFGREHAAPCRRRFVGRRRISLRQSGHAYILVGSLCSQGPRTTVFGCQRIWGWCTVFGTGQVVSSTLPMLVPASSSRWASAALARGNFRCTIGFTFPASINGQTCSRTAATMAAFSAEGRPRNDVAITAPHLRSNMLRSSSALTPPCTPLMNRRPLTASAPTLRAR